MSGAGNVAQYAIEKIIELGGKVVTLSDSSGYIYDEEGIDREKLAFIMRLKTSNAEGSWNTLISIPGGVHGS